MPTYTCPECNVKLRTEGEARPGQKFDCPKCEAVFTPRAETIAFADDDDNRPAKPTVKKPAKKAPPAPVAPPPPARSLARDEDPETYGVTQESEEEKRLAEKNKPVFGAIKDKFRKSARGPAAALLVTPCNLLLAQGGLLSIVGLSSVIIGMFPISFTDVPPSDEEFAECTFWIFFGICAMVWGGITCYGAVQMVGLGSYGWAVVGATFGLFPLLAGVFGLILLRDERVLAGFIEPETGPIQSEADAEKKPNDDEEDEDEKDEDDDEDEDEEDDTRRKPRKRSP